MNMIGGVHMLIPELLESKNMTLYKLSKNSSIPYSTVNDSTMKEQA